MDKNYTEPASNPQNVWNGPNWMAHADPLKYHLDPVERLYSAGKVD